MIKTISSHGRYVMVRDGVPGTVTVYPNNYVSAMGTGNVRFNTSTQCLEVCDGSGWVQLNMGFPQIGLTPDAESLLDWARKKRDEELQIEGLASTSPAINDLLNQINEKRDQIKVIATLIKDEKKVSS